jgi:hypothetical protein
MLSLLYLMIRVLLARLLVTSGRPDDGSKDLEILVLRHQLRVLRRTSGPPKLRTVDGCSRGGQPSDPAGPLGHLHRHPSDAPPVASPAGEAEVDLPQDRSARPAAE